MAKCVLRAVRLFRFGRGFLDSIQKDAAKRAAMQNQIMSELMGSLNSIENKEFRDDLRSLLCNGWPSQGTSLLKESSAKLPAEAMQLLKCIGESLARIGHNRSQVLRSLDDLEKLGLGKLTTTIDLARVALQIPSAIDMQTIIDRLARLTPVKQDKQASQCVSRADARQLSSPVDQLRDGPSQMCPDGETSPTDSHGVGNTDTAHNLLIQMRRSYKNIQAEQSTFSGLLHEVAFVDSARENPAEAVQPEGEAVKSQDSSNPRLQILQKLGAWRPAESMRQTIQERAKMFPPQYREALAMAIDEDLGKVGERLNMGNFNAEQTSTNHVRLGQRSNKQSTAEHSSRKTFTSDLQVHGRCSLVDDTTPNVLKRTKTLPTSSLDITCARSSAVLPLTSANAAAIAPKTGSMLHSRASLARQTGPGVKPGPSMHASSVSADPTMELSVSTCVGGTSGCNIAVGTTSAAESGNQSRSFRGSQKHTTFPSKVIAHHVRQGRNGLGLNPGSAHDHESSALIEPPRALSVDLPRAVSSISTRANSKEPQSQSSKSGSHQLMQTGNAQRVAPPPLSDSCLNNDASKESIVSNTPKGQSPRLGSRKQLPQDPAACAKHAHPHGTQSVSQNLGSTVHNQSHLADNAPLPAKSAEVSTNISSPLVPQPALSAWATSPTEDPHWPRQVYALRHRRAECYEPFLLTDREGHGVWACDPDYAGIPRSAGKRSLSSLTFGTGDDALSAGSDSPTPGSVRTPTSALCSKRSKERLPTLSTCMELPSAKQLLAASGKAQDPAVGKTPILLPASGKGKTPILLTGSGQAPDPAVRKAQIQQELPALAAAAIAAGWRRSSPSSMPPAQQVGIHDSEPDGERQKLEGVTAGLQQPLSLRTHDSEPDPNGELQTLEAVTASLQQSLSLRTHDSELDGEHQELEGVTARLQQSLSLRTYDSDPDPCGELQALEALTERLQQSLSLTKLEPGLAESPSQSSLRHALWRRQRQMWKAKGNSSIQSSKEMPVLQPVPPPTRAIAPKLNTSARTPRRPPPTLQVQARRFRQVRLSAISDACHPWAKLSMNGKAEMSSNGALHTPAWLNRNVQIRLWEWDAGKLVTSTATCAVPEVPDMPDRE